MDFVDCIRMQYDFVKARIERAYQDLTREEIAWQPAPNGKSIGMNFLSQARWMDQYVHSRWRKTLDIWETQGWYKKFNMHIGEPRVDAIRTLEEMKDFVVPPVEDLKAYWDAALEDFLEFLETITDEDLDKIVDYQVGENVSQRSVGTLLSTGVIHLDAYVAQIFYLKHLQKQRVTATG